MREILFRGKTNKGEWVEGSLVIALGWSLILGKRQKEYRIYDLHDNYKRVIPETIGQYTGLTDKNGKKIFEGDIFAHPNKKKYKYIVDWIDDIASFGWFNGNGVGFDNKEIEIIGNIHDNPELLGGDTK